MNRNLARRTIAIPTALVLAVPVATVALVLAAGPSDATPTSAAASSSHWFHDPVSKAARAKEIAVPKSPASYDGAIRHTKADYRTHSGSIAVPVGWARGHRLSTGQAVVLNGAGLFGFDSAKATTTARKQVKRLATSLTGVTNIRCEGYSDYGAHSEHEKSLSKKRAAAVCALVRSSRSSVHTTTVGYGSVRPVIVGGTASDRAQNRRVVIVVRKATPTAPAKPTGPSAPTLTVATPGLGSAALMFTRPRKDGGSPITGYQVSTGAAWTAVTSTGTTTLTADVPNLIGNTTYAIRVRAVNAAGHSAPSNTLSVTPTAAVPGPPVLSSLTPDYVTNGPNAALLNFTFTSAAPNGSPVTGYQWTQDGIHWFNLGYTAGSPNHGSLNVSWNCVPDNDSVAVRGVNAVGPGASSNTSSITLDLC